MAETRWHKTVALATLIAGAVALAWISLVIAIAAGAGQVKASETLGERASIATSERADLRQTRCIVRYGSGENLPQLVPMCSL
jgi:hypothetical protein